MMTAYDANGILVSQQQLSYTTVGGYTSNLYGDLLVTGNSATAASGQPGNWTWHMTGSGITKVVLQFGVGYDPNIAFDTLAFATECLSCQRTAVTANLGNIGVGQSVEGLNVVAPGLNIDADGTAVRIVEGMSPIAYASPINGFSIRNQGLVGDGGFSDMTAQANVQAHRYTFTFAPGVMVGNFNLHMLDFGDYNPTAATSHVATMTAYDANNMVVSQRQLSYTTIGYISNLYGDLLLTGNSASALPGQPGNWIWYASGSGITRVVLEFGVGYDPNIGFDTLRFTVGCP
jgi:hypothetical protein